MRAEVPVFARVTETTAGDVETAHFRGDGRADEDRNQRGKDRQSTAVKETEDESETAKDFEPRQIKCESHTDKPRQRFVIVDVVRELDGVERFDYAGVNENATDDKIDNAPRNLHWPGKLRTPNVQCPMSNADALNFWPLDVGR